MKNEPIKEKTTAGLAKVRLTVKFIKENGETFNRENEPEKEGEKPEVLEHSVPAATAQRWLRAGWVAIIEEAQILEK